LDCAKLHDEMPQLMCVVIQMKCEKSVNQKINTLNINNNKSSAQPNPINQFSLSDGDENIFSVSENWFIGKTFVFVRWEKLLLELLVENSWRMLECKLCSTATVRSFSLYSLFNCLHMQSYGNDGVRRSI
jgi:hypothetical protein